MRVAEPFLTQKDVESVLGSLKLNQLSGRTDVCRSFEAEYAHRMGTKYAISVNSGTSALFLALKALKIGVGDEVIIPAYAYIAVANAVTHAGATPVLVDVEPDTFNIDPNKIKISRKTKAIIVVHTYGHACDMDRIMALGVPVIEDAAEAHGGTYKGRILGSIGAFGCFSFFANKTITTGEGGMIITNDEAAFKELTLMKDQYLIQGYRHDKIGWSLCMNGLSCSLGRSQLSQLDEFLRRKADMATAYQTLDHLIGSPVVKDYAGHSWWMYAVKRHRELESFLHECGIETRPGFVPIHKQAPYLNLDGSYPVAESVNIMCLPMNLNTGNFEVIEKIKAFYGV